MIHWTSPSGHKISLYRDTLIPMPWPLLCTGTSPSLLPVISGDLFKFVHFLTSGDWLLKHVGWASGRYTSYWNASMLLEMIGKRMSAILWILSMCCMHRRKDSLGHNTGSISNGNYTKSQCSKRNFSNQC